LERRILKILNQIKYSCSDHINIAIDDFLIENETYPNLVYADTSIQEKSNLKCDYCSKNALYVLKLKP
jgi:CxxH/CxxC protein (TIGR04129 family)